MTWAADGWLYQLGVLDFAGGLVVHTNSACGALALTAIIGPCLKRNPADHDEDVVYRNFAFLWLGWFCFNAGSALAANESAGLAAVTTISASCAGAMAWAAAKRFGRGKRARLIDVMSGAIAGLVAITPAAGFVSPFGSSMLIGAAGALASCYALDWLKGVHPTIEQAYKNGHTHMLGLLDRFRCRIHDTGDVIMVHGLAGLSGTFLTGVFASSNFGDGSGLIDGNAYQIVVQLMGAGIAVSFSVAMSFAIAAGVNYYVPFRVSAEQETLGLDHDISEYGASTRARHASELVGIDSGSHVPARPVQLNAHEER
jgi:Amt family ammonium transporter